MKKCCSGLALVSLLCVAFSVGHAEIDFHGVLNANTHAAWVDTAFLSVGAEVETVLTSGWGSESGAYDTFDFPSLERWPVFIILAARVDGTPTKQPFPGPVNGVFYPFMGVPPPPPKVMFWSQVAIEAEPRDRAPRTVLRVTPSVVTSQMKVSLQYAGPGRAAVEMLDAAGNLVRSLDCTDAGNGLATATWNREDGRGHLVPGGIYFCRYAASGASTVRKILVTD